jgi:glycosyltransferase involved in cell wall biosynthesis
LAREVRSLSLISYKYAMNFDHSYADATRKHLAHATWINDPQSPTYKMLDASEVAAHLNAARVGLCLSSEEGAMYASIQYLLCGLPVVSTRSIGGRDVLFNETDCLIVDDNPRAVADGVREMIGRKLPPAEVRARAIAAMEIHRSAFADTVQRFLNESGSVTQFEPLFRKSFVNKLVTLTSAAAMAKTAKSGQ